MTPLNINDNLGRQILSVALGFFASKLAPTGLMWLADNLLKSLLIREKSHASESEG